MRVQQKSSRSEPREDLARKLRGLRAGGRRCPSSRRRVGARARSRRTGCRRVRARAAVRVTAAGRRRIHDRRVVLRLGGGRRCGRSGGLDFGPLFAAGEECRAGEDAEYLLHSCVWMGLALGGLSKNRTQPAIRPCLTICSTAACARRVTFLRSRKPRKLHTVPTARLLPWRYNAGSCWSPCASATASSVSFPSRVLIPPTSAGTFAQAPSKPRFASSST